MKLRKWICSLDLEGKLDKVIERLNNIITQQTKNGFTDLEIEEEYEYDNCVTTSLYGMREETTREKGIREGKKLVAGKKQKEDEITMLKSLRKRYPNE